MMDADAGCGPPAGQSDMLRWKDDPNSGRAARQAFACAGNHVLAARVLSGVESVSKSYAVSGAGEAVDGAAAATAGLQESIAAHIVSGERPPRPQSGKRVRPRFSD